MADRLRSADQDRILELERSMRNVLSFCSKLTYRLRNRPGFVVDEEALQHLLRFCADAGFESSALRRAADGITDLDEVLDAYRSASQEKFCAKTLQRFLAQYPQHAEALRRYAHVQLTFVPARGEELTEQKHLDLIERLTKAMVLWGAEEDGIPDGGPIGEAYDAAGAHLKEHGRG